jgi:hypothetical protein
MGSGKQTTLPEIMHSPRARSDARRMKLWSSSRSRWVSRGLDNPIGKGRNEGAPMAKLEQSSTTVVECGHGASRVFILTGHLSRCCLYT